MSLSNTCVANLEVVTEIFSVSHTGQRQIIARLTVLILNLLLWTALWTECCLWRKTSVSEPDCFGVVVEFHFYLCAQETPALYRKHLLSVSHIRMSVHSLEAISIVHVEWPFSKALPPFIAVARAGKIYKMSYVKELKIALIIFNRMCSKILDIFLILARIMYDLAKSFCLFNHIHCKMRDSPRFKS